MEEVQPRSKWAVPDTLQSAVPLYVSQHLPSPSLSSSPLVCLSSFYTSVPQLKRPPFPLSLPFLLSRPQSSLVALFRGRMFTPTWATNGQSLFQQLSKEMPGAYKCRQHAHIKALLGACGVLEPSVLYSDEEIPSKNICIPTVLKYWPIKMDEESDLHSHILLKSVCAYI